MDFILTIEAESRWDIKAIWDWGKSFGLCQVNVRWHKLPKDYLTSIKVQIDHCWKLYKWYKDQKILHKRLFWYNVRNRYSHLYR
jgi:hypothetical protein